MGKRLRQHEQTEVRKNSVYVCCGVWGDMVAGEVTWGRRGEVALVPPGYKEGSERQSAK